MSYGPEVVHTLSNRLTQLDLHMPGYGFWYGEAGKDVDLAKMILDEASLADIKAYVVETYGDPQEEELDY